MRRSICPSCKSRIPDSAKRCNNCGYIIPAKTNVPDTRNKSAIIFASIVIVVAVYLLLLILDHYKLFTIQSITEEKKETLTQEALVNTLRDMEGAELTTDDVMLRFNSFMQDEGAGEYSIKELVLSSGETEDIYSDIKNNEDISISMVTPKGLNTITSIFVSARSGNEKPTAFITYCYGLMNIFNPTMKPDVRENVLSQMIGYSENGDIPLHDEKAYIIMKTKYIISHSESKGLNIRVIQMPPLEEVQTNNLSPLIRK